MYMLKVHALVISHAIKLSQYVGAQHSCTSKSSLIIQYVGSSGDLCCPITWCDKQRWGLGVVSAASRDLGRVPDNIRWGQNNDQWCHKRVLRGFGAV